MKIYLSTSTVGRSGGGFKNNLNFFEGVIKDRFDNSGFKSSFEELWLTLAYPPMYILPGILGMEKRFKEFYDELPYSRFSRKYNKMEITLKAPEFSEHFDKEDQGKYKNKFTIESQYKNLSEIDLTRAFIDKLISAGEIIEKKLKKDDIFNISIYYTVLNQLKDEITEKFILQNSKEQSQKVRDAVLLSAINHRKQRASEQKVFDKHIKDIRVYYSNLPIKALYPFDYQYREIFLNLLHKNGLLCPTYDHLYIRVGEDRNDCLRYSIPVEKWLIYGVSVIDFEKYKTQSEIEKEKTVFKAIVDGLYDIFTIDNFDKAILKKTIKQIEKFGLNTELYWQTIENRKYILNITYYSRCMEDECPIFLTLMDKKTSIIKRVKIGKADISQIPYWLQKIQLTQSKVIIKSSTSLRADVWLENKPRKLEFSIEKIMQKNSL
jgi:hypothetical protein